MIEKDDEYQADARWWRKSEPLRYANQREAFIDVLIKLVVHDPGLWPEPLQELAIAIMKDRRG